MNRPVSGSKATGKQPVPHSAATSTTASGQTGAQRPTKTATKHAPKTGTYTSIIVLLAAAHPEAKTESKLTARDSFIKKVQTCMNTYNYDDESTDVKGKVLHCSVTF